MKKITVTGGAGRLGRMVVDDLLARGYEVLAVDRVRPATVARRFLQLELTDAAAVYDALRGQDAVVHLGAIPGPTSAPQSTTFRDNVLSTYYVAEAAAALGLKKLVFASSLFALGWAEDADRFWPKYVPVDEDHPLTPFEAYGLSKQVGEDICAAMSRRTGLSCVSLRITNIIQPDGYHAMPWPRPTQAAPTRFAMWPYTDARDAAQACRLALEAPIVGHEAFFIAAKEIRFDCPTRELLREIAPADIEIRGELAGRASVLSIEKARRMLGYCPQYRWQDLVKLSG